jgi:hypothetical protein
MIYRPKEALYKGKKCLSVKKNDKNYAPEITSTFLSANKASAFTN